MPTDITEDVVREVALPTGLVDVKVCAIDDTWSGLRAVPPQGAAPRPHDRRRLSCCLLRSVARRGPSRRGPRRRASW